MDDAPPTGPTETIPSDAVELALAEALKGATAACEWSTVARLADELQARRLARSAPNVVTLGPLKRGAR